MRSVVRSERATVPGPAGRLEAAIDSVDTPARAIAVVCHPHPLQQGTMQNKVVTTIARAFAQLGAQVLRFNFRGVGASEGSYADGIGERADALAAIAWSRERCPGLDLYLGGFSFGAAIALGIAAEAGASGLVTIAPPLDRLPAGFVPPDCPWLLIHGDGRRRRAVSRDRGAARDVQCAAARARDEKRRALLPRATARSR